MLRIHFLKLWFNLSDPAVEEALYDSVAMRSVVGIDLGVEGVPDETMECKFRHLLERHKLSKVLLQAVNDHLHRSGIKITTGTIVDAAIIVAPSLTKNRDGRRNPQMHQTAKGRQWYFGMKAHVGVDSRTKLVHAVVASAANVHDREALPPLLHGKETHVWDDQVYQGQREVIRARAPKAKYRNKSRVRAKAEHVFGVIKNIFGFRKVRYRGLAKNLHRLEVTAALANLYIVRRRLLRA